MMGISMPRLHANHFITLPRDLPRCFIPFFDSFFYLNSRSLNFLYKYNKVSIALVDRRGEGRRHTTRGGGVNSH